jgi:chromosome segregation ATPase
MNEGADLAAFGQAASADMIHLHRVFDGDKNSQNLEIMRLTEKISELKGLLDAGNLGSIGLERIVDEKNSELTRLNETVAELKKQLEAANSEIIRLNLSHSLSIERERVDSMHSEKKSEIMRLNETVIELKEQLDAANSEREREREREKEREEERIRINRVVDSTHNEKNSEIMRLNEIVIELKEQLGAVNSERVKEGEKAREREEESIRIDRVVDSRHSEKNSEIMRLNETFAELKEQLDAATSEDTTAAEKWCDKTAEAPHIHKQTHTLSLYT